MLSDTVPVQETLRADVKRAHEASMKRLIDNLQELLQLERDIYTVHCKMSKTKDENARFTQVNCVGTNCLHKPTLSITHHSTQPNILIHLMGLDNDGHKQWPWRPQPWQLRTCFLKTVWPWIRREFGDFWEVCRLFFTFSLLWLSRCTLWPSWFVAVMV